MEWSTRLVQIFVYCCDQYQQGLDAHCQRLSNNSHPNFTDEEVVTIYLFGIIQGRKTIKEIYRYTQDHLRDWFPTLPSYAGYVQRLNLLEDFFPALVEQILDEASNLAVLWKTRLLDSMPIIMANAKRSSKAKVARHFANKGYCASKGFYYYGVKLHLLGLKRQGTLPVPDYVGLTPASDHDLTALRIISPSLIDGELYADKAYIDELLTQALKAKQNLSLWTPIKKAKGQEELFLLDRLLSQSVNSIRQPIESLFNWIEQKTGIQLASKVRSYNGLMVHVFGRLAAAMFILAFNS